MSEYNAFLDIVRERHDPNVKRDELICPYCDSKEVTNYGTSTTLVGGYNNHLTTSGECKKCNKKFTLQVKECGEKYTYIAWYVSEEGKVLKGIPGCYESYTYTCSKCGGDVVREYLDKNSDNPVKWLTSGPDLNGVWENNYRIFFKCKDCGINVESKNENYNPDPPKEMSYEEKVEQAKKEKNLKIGWTITEEIGDCIINDSVIAKFSV